jgi:hypothetical protein
MLVCNVVYFGESQKFRGNISLPSSESKGTSKKKAAEAEVKLRSLGLLFDSEIETIYSSETFGSLRTTSPYKPEGRAFPYPSGSHIKSI